MTQVLPTGRDGDTGRDSDTGAGRDEDTGRADKPMLTKLEDCACVRRCGGKFNFCLFSSNCHDLDL